MEFNYDNENLDTSLDNIKKGDKKIFAPICGGLAYVECEVTNKENLYVHIGEDLFVKTKIDRVYDIIKRKKKAMKFSKMTKIDDNTFEIVEEDFGEEKPKKTNEEKSKKEAEEKISKDKLIEAENQKKLEEIFNYKPKSSYNTQIKLKDGKNIIREMINEYKKKKK